MASLFTTVNFVSKFFLDQVTLTVDILTLKSPC